jgi:hypothetical protein
MKTIEQAAGKYAVYFDEKCQPNGGFLFNEDKRCGFIAGAEFAQQWISVDDELPEENYVRCLVDNGNNEYMIAVYTINGWAFPTAYQFYEDTYEVKFWRPNEIKHN